MTVVWVTRTLPGALATADRVRAVGFDALVAPLLEVVFEPGKIDLNGVGAIAFTSANGVRAFAERTEARDRPVFAVGRGTAKAAREAGFASVTTSEGDVLTLARAIPSGGVVLHCGAAEPAADLALALARRGVEARSLVVYRTVVASLSPSERVAAGRVDFVLLQSAKAARALRDLGIRLPRPVCLSLAVATALGSEGASLDRRIAAAPTEDALIAALIEAAR